MRIAFVDPKPSPPKDIRIDLNYLEFNNLVWVLDIVNAHTNLQNSAAQSIARNFLQYLEPYKQER